MANSVQLRITHFGFIRTLLVPSNAIFKTLTLELSVVCLRHKMCETLRKVFAFKVYSFITKTLNGLYLVQSKKTLFTIRICFENFDIFA